MVKVLFFGTPEIAVPYLKWLVDHTKVLGVVCKPDEPVGRGLELTPPPVKVFAQKKNLSVYQPEGKWTPDIVKSLKDIGADLGVVVAYGRIMPEPVFMAPKLGCINIHFSLLPKYRGAAPMQWALINGETKTGISAFWLDTGMDSGPVFHQQELAIAPDDDALSLKDKLVPLGVSVLEQVIKDVETAHIVRKPQQGDIVMAPLLKKETGCIDWSWPAERIVNLVRGVRSWPGATTSAASKQLKVLRARVVAGGALSGQRSAGVIIEAIKDEGILVRAGSGEVLLLEVQPEGKKPMPAWSFWQGARMKEGDKLG